MTKAFAALHAGLVARRERRPAPPMPLPEELPAPITTVWTHQPWSCATPAADSVHCPSPSASLASDLISAGRNAYREERQRRAENAAASIWAVNKLWSVEHGYASTAGPPARSSPDPEPRIDRRPSPAGGAPVISFRRRAPKRPVTADVAWANRLMRPLARTAILARKPRLVLWVP